MRNQTLAPQSFHYQFKRIVFAIFDDHNAHQTHNPDGNFKPFYDVFYNKQ